MKLTCMPISCVMARLILNYLTGDYDDWTGGGRFLEDPSTFDNLLHSDIKIVPLVCRKTILYWQGIVCLSVGPMY